MIQVFQSIKEHTNGIVLFVLPILGLSLWEATVAPPSNALSAIMYVISLVALILLIWRPLQFSIVILIVGIASSIVPYINSTPSQFFTTLVALGCIGYISRIWLIAVSLIVVIITQLFQSYLHIGNASYDNLLFFIIIMSFAVLAGYALRQKNNIAQLKLEKKDQNLKLQMALQKNRIAEQIHDMVSNNLSTIARESQEQLHQEENSQAWVTINHLATDSISQLHQLIDELLKHVEPTSDNSSVAEFSNKLSQLVYEQHRILEVQGFTCLMNITGNTGHNPSLEIQREVFNLIIELSANIQKHCQRGTSCELSIHCSQDAIVLSERCIFASTIDQQEKQYNLGGYGLKTRKQLIEKLNGQFVWKKTSNEWLCYANIPL